jgi:Leucine-rich repeat (LRR) protein
MLCSRLQNLPERLHSLPNLKRLYIWECKALRKLHKAALPSSLQELVITGCPEISSLPSLPSSLKKLVIKSCRRIDELPKVDELPSSLREVDVRDSRSEELRRHCRELIGIIPIIRA